MPPEESPTPEESPLKQIRTYEGDVVEAIKSQGESIISINRAEEAKRNAAKNFGASAAVEESGSRALLMAVLTLTLFSLGAFGSWYAYKTYKEKTALPITETPANELIAASSIVNIDASTLSRDSLISKINAERAKEGSASSVKQIELYRGTGAAAKLLTSSEFMLRLGTHATASLVRAFNPTFMLGTLGSGPSHPFLLIKVDSFVNAYPGLLVWETKLADDLLPIIKNSSVTFGTTTAWSDITLANRDARVLKDAEGQTVMLYAFYDNSILIVTDNEDAFKALISKIENQKLVR